MKKDIVEMLLKNERAAAGVGLRPPQVSDSDLPESLIIYETSSVIGKTRFIDIFCIRFQKYA